jgi:hypothetical protein
VLEYAQQAGDNEFRATLRGAYEFGFHTRGLSVLHFATVDFMDASEPAVNMTDFSRKNYLPPASNSPSYTELVEALRNLRCFGRTFYNPDTVSVLESALRFIESFARGEEPDGDTTRRLARWLDMKLGRFRGLILSGGLSEAIRVQTEFSLQDPLLAKLLYDQQQSTIAGLLAKLQARPSNGNSGKPITREPRGEKKSGIPKSVINSLPKQGSLQLCMKHLPNAGCAGGSEPGKCFALKRAHFRPKKLPKNVKEHIDKAFGGLAPEFADL